MATYCFKCVTCGNKAVQATRSPEPTCPSDHIMRRDYQAENVGANLGNLKVQRESGGKEGVKRLFLPSNKDFAGPGDPDGTKGMRNWRETHQPKAGNGKPDWPGTIDKKVW